MGLLLYGSPGIEIKFDDRALQHLQIVITAKLRRHESFVFSWNDAPETGSGRSSIWLDPSSTLCYRYFGSRIPSINREWVDALMESANSGSGLNFLPEPPAHHMGHVLSETEVRDHHLN
ncbi:DUF7882 family protein [Subtercola frigoramans]|uniref:DUF7882 domain-containing protein n=1 Tax=Subtercola frigoramans TaxID=120298 RepID=A0ABS2L3V7_9MICO|nr:ATP-dependent DNA ligase [Subtercola frigoramans]MBM7471576.1 hypothetical protein [Subtercola frigoramans]